MSAGRATSPKRGSVLILVLWMIILLGVMQLGDGETDLFIRFLIFTHSIASFAALVSARAVV